MIEPIHARPRPFPRGLGQKSVGLTQSFPRVLRERRFDCSDEFIRVVRDSGQALDSVRPHDVPDRGGDNGLAGGEVLGRFGRADIAGGLVTGERQQRHIPPGDVRRQLVVGLGPEIVDVRRDRQHGRVDLDHRPDDHQMPVRAQLRHPAQQLEIHPLVDDTKESKSRMRNGRLIVTIRLCHPATREVRPDPRCSGRHGHSDGCVACSRRAYDRP